MSIKPSVLAALVLLLAACSPPPLSLPPGSDTAQAPVASRAASLANAFSEDPQVQQLAACASASLRGGSGEDWKRRVEKLRTIHRQMLPGKEKSAVESDAIKAVFDAQRRLKESGVTKETMGAYLQDNCVGI